MSVLTAIDGEEGSATVVAEAAELAERLGEELVVLHVDLGGDREEAERVAESVVAEALDDPDRATVRISDGTPAERILDIADETGADYVVIGSSKRTPVGKVVLGSTLQLVLRGAEVPVVTVKQRRGA